MNDEDFNNMLISLTFGAFILLLIAAPSFCFKVDEEQFQRLKKLDAERKQQEYLENLKKKCDQKGPLGAPEDSSNSTKQGSSSTSSLNSSNSKAKEKKSE